MIGSDIGLFKKMVVSLHSKQLRAHGSILEEKDSFSAGEQAGHEYRCEGSRAKQR